VTHKIGKKIVWKESSKETSLKNKDVKIPNKLGIWSLNICKKKNYARIHLHLWNNRATIKWIKYRKLLVWEWNHGRLEKSNIIVATFENLHNLFNFGYMVNLSIPPKCVRPNELHQYHKPISNTILKHPMILDLPKYPRKTLKFLTFSTLAYTPFWALYGFCCVVFYCMV